MLSGCNGEEAERKRLELQRAVDALQFEARPGKMLPLAISVGAAVFPHDGDSYETLLATADSRMYRDKTRRKRESGAADTALRAAAGVGKRPGARGHWSALAPRETGAVAGCSCWMLVARCREAPATLREFVAGLATSLSSKLASTTPSSTQSGLGAGQAGPEDREPGRADDQRQPFHPPARRSGR